MATVTIRNLDDAVIERLKQMAKANTRSLDAELRALLTDASARWSPRELRALADRIATMTPNMPQTDSTELLREDRNR